MENLHADAESTNVANMPKSEERRIPTCKVIIQGQDAVQRNSGEEFYVVCHDFDNLT
jgi:hypothetical protein